MGFHRQEYWSELQFPSPGDLPDPGIEPGLLHLQADSLPSEPPRPSGGKAEAMAWNGAEEGRRLRGTMSAQMLWGLKSPWGLSPLPSGGGSNYLWEALDLASLGIEFSPSPGEGSSKSQPGITGQFNNFTRLERGLHWQKHPQPV